MRSRQGNCAAQQDLACGPSHREEIKDDRSLSLADSLRKLLLVSNSDESEVDQLTKKMAHMCNTNLSDAELKRVAECFGSLRVNTGDSDAKDGVPQARDSICSTRALQEHFKPTSGHAGPTSTGAAPDPTQQASQETTTSTPRSRSPMDWSAPAPSQATQAAKQPPFEQQHEAARTFASPSLVAAPSATQNGTGEGSMFAASEKLYVPPPGPANVTTSPQRPSVRRGVSRRNRSRGHVGPSAGGQESASPVKAGINNSQQQPQAQSSNSFPASPQVPQYAAKPVHSCGSCKRSRR